MNSPSRRFPTLPASLRDSLCAAIALLATTSLSWSFVHSTQSLRWMGEQDATVISAPVLFNQS